MLIIYTQYISRYIGQDTKAKRVWRQGICMFAVLAIAMVVLSQFNHMYYYIDANNLYHRGSLFFLSQVFGIVGALVNTIILIIYRKDIEKRQFVAFVAYIILPFIAMIIQIFVYGIALLNIAITISVLWMFISLQIDREIR